MEPTLIPPITKSTLETTATENQAKLSTGIDGHGIQAVLDGENDCIQFRMQLFRPPNTTSVGRFNVAGLGASSLESRPGSREHFRTVNGRINSCASKFSYSIYVGSG